jgi:hypothetical protein
MGFGLSHHFLLRDSVMRLIGSITNPFADASNVTFTPSYGGFAPTAEKTVGPARIIVGYFVPQTPDMTPLIAYYR